MQCKSIKERAGETEEGDSINFTNNYAVGEEEESMWMEDKWLNGMFMLSNVDAVLNIRAPCLGPYDLNVSRFGGGQREHWQTNFNWKI